MALIVCIIIAVSCTFSAVNDPFPAGRSMGDMGTILWSDNASGRQPWLPAAIMSGDTMRFGLAVAAVSYYDRMDNLKNASINQAALGGWLSIAAGLCVLKTFYSRLSALGAYFEDEAYLSIATNSLTWLRFGFNVAAYRLGVLGMERQSVYLVRIGESMWVPFRFTAVSICAEHLSRQLWPKAHSVALPAVLSIGFHTTRHRFGAQGIVVEIRAEEPIRVNIRLGQQYWFHRCFAVSAAVAANPFMLSFGLTFEQSAWSATAALVHHPLLGWSRGAAADWTG